jgi:hypothetical protein
MRWTVGTALLLAACGDGSRSSSPRSREIARGTAFAATDYQVPGHVVLLEFYADW